MLWKINYMSRHIKFALLLTSLLLIITILLHVAIVLFGNDDLGDVNYLELHKCPACFGTSACTILQEGEVNFEGLYKFRLTDHINFRNVMFGKFNSKRVVIKRLAQDGEIFGIDQSICRNADLDGKCDVAFAINSFNPLRENELNALMLANISDMFTCPSERLLQERIKTTYMEQQSKHFAHKEKAYLMTTLLTNEEPIILQAFPQSEGWPFPKYIGACGRVIVVEYVGKTLEHYYNAPWKMRVDFAYQVMKMMEMFTDNWSGFALYWTDLKWSNLAVNADGRIMVIDAENIIVVDKAKIRRDKSPGYDKGFYATYDVCQPVTYNCDSFKKNKYQLCNQVNSDFNYYMACHSLLSSHASTWWLPGGLLHDPPAYVEQKWQLSQLLVNCSNPSILDERIQLKTKILDVLKIIKGG